MKTSNQTQTAADQAHVLSEEEQIKEAMRRGEEAAQAAIEAEEAQRVAREEELAVEAEAVAEGGDGAEDTDGADGTGDSGDEGSSEPDVDQAEVIAAELAKAQERVLRIQADWENFRRRTEADRAQERVRATQRLVEELLPVVDDIERALDHAKQQDDQVKENEVFAGFVSGVDAIAAKLIQALASVGVQSIDPAGEPFDLSCHQAVAQIEDPSVFDETVRDVYQKGYRMGDYVLRPAMVTVTQGGPAREKPAGDQE